MTLERSVNDYEPLATTRAARFISQPIRNSGLPSGLPTSLHPLLKHQVNEAHDTHPVKQSIPNEHTNEHHTTPTYPPKNLNHAPVPATEVFSRRSAPIFLPKLDKHLATLPEPRFRTRTSSSKAKDPEMFPPMQSLSNAGASLEDLERNKKYTSLNRATILGFIVTNVLGILGSSAVATYYSLQGLINTVQIFALLLNTLLPFTDNKDYWESLFLGTIPNILAFNFASTAVQSLIFLVLFTALALGLLYYFYISSRHCERYDRIEGLQRVHPERKRWSLVIVTFLLTVIYLPLSTMALHVIVWSDDIWIVPNPYSNSTTSPPVLPPLGPASEYRDPLDFCWTTTMKRNEVNFAPVIVLLSALVVITFTIWFPLALHRVLAKAVPKVDTYTELGRHRTAVELDIAYHHLLTRDSHPFAFLYSGFRRGWGSYQSIYLFAKLSTLLIVTVIDPNNCLFRSQSHTIVAVIRQVFLLLSTIGFFLAQCFFAPFLDPISNASEWVSRLNYVATALLALLVALDVPWKDALNSYVLYTIYIVTYGLSFYFVIINQGWMHNLVKRLTGRIDFSIDIFSPRLDVSSSSVHTRRRIWQESISTLFLTDPECKIPKHQTMPFAQARDSIYPPYLLDFSGSPAERHVENLKILREVGSAQYHKAISLIFGPDSERYKRLEEEIQGHYIGPDCFWKDPRGSGRTTTHSHFGNAWWIPFPPTLIIRFDDGPYAVLQDVTDLEAYITQNSSRSVRRKRELRMALRCLDGQRVVWPCVHSAPIGSSHPLLCCRRNKYSMNSTIHYDSCTFRIVRRGHLVWQGLDLGSGFQVKLDYAPTVQLDGSAIGLNDDFEPTAPIVEFLALNREKVVRRLGDIEMRLQGYRHHHQLEFQKKKDVLSYRFLSVIYERPQDQKSLAKVWLDLEHDERVCRLLESNASAFTSAYERFSAVSSSETATWWYIFWDDLWRRNHTTISALQTYATDFNPYYPTSIAYRPLPRPALEAFLVQRGLLSKVAARGDVFHSGLLNKIYLRLNETVFHKSSGAVFFHLGYDTSELDMESLDEREDLASPSAMGTGGGTDHDDSAIITRPNYRWEGLLEDPLRRDQRKRRRVLAKLGAWFGISPLWKSEMPSRGVSLDVRLEHGRYVLVDS